MAPKGQEPFVLPMQMKMYFPSVLYEQGGIREQYWLADEYGYIVRTRMLLHWKYTEVQVRQVGS